MIIPGIAGKHPSRQHKKKHLIETGIEGGWAFNPYRAESMDVKRLTFFIVHRSQVS